MPLLTACAKGSGLPSASRKRSGRAAAGAVSRLSYVRICPSAAEYNTMKAPPPMPDDCGSTRLSTSCVAMAASTTLPPRRSMASPARLARGLADTIMKCGARTSSRFWTPLAASGFRSSAAGVRAQLADANGRPAMAAASSRAAWRRRRMESSGDRRTSGRRP